MNAAYDRIKTDVRGAINTVHALTKSPVKEVIMVNEILSHNNLFPVQNLAGRVFGRWTVVAFIEHARGVDRWQCGCICGVVRSVKADNLLKGLSVSCGCYARTVAVTHGMHNTPEYDAFIAARQRCTNPKTAGYELYGGRGIKFLFGSFEEFYAEIGARPSAKHSLDRYPNFNGHYEAGNVRWATAHEQNRNKRNNHRITYSGETLILADWADRAGIKSSLLRNRLNANWCFECAFTLPLHSSCRHRTHGTKYDAKRVEASESPELVK